MVFGKSLQFLTTLIRKVILEKVQLSETDISALAIFILSHGEDNGTIFASDYPFRVDHDILFPLAADKCPALAGKPKLIFVQVCEQFSAYLSWFRETATIPGII